MKYDFHIHYNYSKDVPLKPETILKITKIRNVN